MGEFGNRVSDLIGPKQLTMVLRHMVFVTSSHDMLGALLLL